MSDRGLRLVTTRDVGEPSDDPRVTAVLEVLSGRSLGAVATKWGLETSLVQRWVSAFIDAGTAQVTNRPDPEDASRRDRFLTAFAHELRTPLAVAQGWVDVLAEGDLPPAFAEQTIGRLGDSLHRLRERVLDVELLGSSSLGRVQLAPVDTTAGTVVEGLGVEVSAEDAARPITVDVALFRRVLRDLVEAASLPPQPRSLLFQSRYDPPWVEIRLRRDADPIEPRVLQALLDPFEVNDDATGVTIGLYLARALTVAHGGSLGLEQDDSGAVFWVRIPSTRNQVSATHTQDDQENR